jgi:hypothetical protein
MKIKKQSIHLKKRSTKKSKDPPCSNRKNNTRTPTEESIIIQLSEHIKLVIPVSTPWWIIIFCGLLFLAILCIPFFN